MTLSVVITLKRVSLVIISTSWGTMYRTWEWVLYYEKVYARGVRVMRLWIAPFKPLSANPTKWPNTLKQFVGKLPTNCLSVFGHFEIFVRNKERNIAKAVLTKRFFCKVRVLHAFGTSNMRTTVSGFRLLITIQ